MFFKKKEKKIIELCVTLYKLIVKQARTKEFYSNLKIPDTIDGRFELIILHFFLLERNCWERYPKQTTEAGINCKAGHQMIQDRILSPSWPNTIRVSI